MERVLARWLVQTFGHLGWDKCQLAWLTGLLIEGTVFRRVGSQQWYLSLGHLEGLTAIAWPLTHHGASSKQSMILGKIRVSELEWIAVVDLDDYECMPIEAVSPLNAHPVEIC